MKVVSCLLSRLAVAAGVACIGMVLQAGAASATVITFGGVANGSTSYSESGLTFTDNLGAFEPQYYAGFASSNEEPISFTVTTQAGGGVSAFDLLSEQFMAINGAQPTMVISFSGTSATGASEAGSFTVPADTSNVFTYAPATLTDLTSVTFSDTGSPSGGGFYFGNFTFAKSAVPEPGTLAILGGALVLLGCTRRTALFG